ncbi:ATP-binding protein, partial [Rodentibacter caecimuris]
LYLYKLENREEQIKTELTQFLYNLQPNQSNIVDSYQDLKQLIYAFVEQLEDIDVSPSLVSLQQMFSELHRVIEPNQELDLLIQDILKYQKYSLTLFNQKNDISIKTQSLIKQGLNQAKENFIELNDNLKIQTQLSGIIIILFLVIFLLIIWLFNQYYIKKNLALRFSKLIESIEYLNQGKTNISIEINGKDEITEISRLLSHHIQILQERDIIENDLKETQNELIQAAKMAVVGQTMTTLAHEINQPLNAISIYLFSLKKLINQQSYSQCQDYIEKIEKLADRISNIIKALRQFSKNEQSSEYCQHISLRQSLNEAWSILELRHKPLDAQLHIHQDCLLFASPILLEQVFVNILANALEANQIKPIIQVYAIAEHGKTYIIIEDNGCGWQIDQVDKLLQPFFSTKTVGLGLGLVISQRIMRQFNGNLYIASSLTKSAVIILEFLQRKG